MITEMNVFSSKKKSLLLLIGSILFVSLGFLLLINHPKITAKIVGVLSILFFSLGIYVGIKSLYKKRLLLSLDYKGLTIDPEKANHKIEWSDIEKFSEISLFGNKFIVIIVDNPQYWIENEQNKVYKKIMKFNLSQYNSPFAISTNNMKISHNKLYRALKANLKLYKL